MENEIKSYSVEIGLPSGSITIEIKASSLASEDELFNIACEELKREIDNSAKLRGLN